MGQQLKVSSDRLEKPGIEPATPDLQGKWQAGLSHTPDGPQCSSSPQLQHTAHLPHLFSW